MRLEDLLEAVRSMLDDTVGPYLWSDEELTRWANNAVREVCIRARLLKVDDVSDPDRCIIQVAAGQALVPLDPSILVPGSGYIPGSVRKLYAVTAKSLDRIEPSWDDTSSQTPDTPEYMVMDLAQKKVRLWPAPATAIELHIRAWRMPVGNELMDGPKDEPVVQVPNGEDLKHWICYEAYLKQGAETYDTGKAETQLAIFERRFGGRPTFHDMARWADSPPRVRHARMF